MAYKTILKKIILMVLLVFCISLMYKSYFFKQYIYKEYIIFYADTILAMHVDFQNSPTMTSDDYTNLMKQYNDIINANTFYKNYSKIDKNFQKLYQKQSSTLLFLSDTNKPYTTEQINSIRNYIRETTKATSQNKSFVNLRKNTNKLNIKVNDELYILFQEINLEAYKVREKTQL